VDVENMSILIVVVAVATPEIPNFTGNLIEKDPEGIAEADVEPLTAL